MAIGFKGKYFTLAAITATVSASLLSAEALATNETIFVSKNAKEKEAQELDEESPTVVISKKIKPKKVDFFSANKTPTISTNLTDNIKIITSEELKLKGVSTLKEALSFEAFTTSSGRFGQNSSIFLQGMSNEYTLFLLNGVRLNDPTSLSGANISHLLLDDVERIEIIKGAQSGVWGADAAAGAINIITKEPKAGVGASAGMEMGSYGYKRAKGALSYKNLTSGIGLSFSRLLYDGPSAMSKKGESLKNFEDDPYRNTTLSLSAHHWINPDSKIEVGYRDVNAFVHYDGFNFNGLGDPNIENSASHKEKSGYLIYDYFHNAHAISLKLSKSDSKREHYEAYPYQYRGKSSEIELKDSFKYALDGTLVVGGSFRKDEGQIDSKEREFKNSALFINNNYKIEDLVLTQALRFDHFNDFKDKTTGKLGAKYSFFDDLSIYFNFGTAYKAPLLTQTYNPFGNFNLNLSPEKIKSYNFGVDFYSFKLNLFYNEIKNLIDWKNSAYENIDGKSKFKGVELSYSEALSEYFLAGGSFTYIDAKSEEKTRLSNRPIHQTSGFLTFIPTKNLQLTTTGSYIGARTDYSTKETGRYFVANFKANYEMDKNWNIYARVENIFDKKYQEVDGYTALDRSFYMGFDWKF
ncbi:MAG: TonB-dependent receptor [Sulfurospirillaceae bacterium]|nr:TonB-dependent receptor [Sulfurospirillaceae bacterium]MCK9545857.1 TonB-dependent receptor [Sulfurospirillaceae bacterium]